MLRGSQQRDRRFDAFSASLRLPLHEGEMNRELAPHRSDWVLSNAVVEDGKLVDAVPVAALGSARWGNARA